jgi:hypothetical protein
MVFGLAELLGHAMNVNSMRRFLCFGERVDDVERDFVSDRVNGSGFQRRGADHAAHRCALVDGPQARGCLERPAERAGWRPVSGISGSPTPRIAPSPRSSVAPWARWSGIPPLPFDKSEE